MSKPSATDGRARRIRWLRMNVAWSPRCGARTRAGTPCRAPAVRGKARCRMHGAAAGAPPGNANRLVHGRYTHATQQERQRIDAFIKAAEAQLSDLED